MIPMCFEAPFVICRRLNGVDMLELRGSVRFLIRTYPTNTSGV